MKTFRRLLLIGLAIALFIPPVHQVIAQQAIPGATPVQQFQPLYACDQSATATGVANTTVTLTMTPPSGQFVYICTLDLTTVANAAVTAAAGPAQIFTTTNFQTNLVWWGDNGTYAAGQQKQALVLSTGAVPIKSASAGTAVTIVATGGQSTYNVRMNMTAFFKP